jgi:hypothetical protein
MSLRQRSAHALRDSARSPSYPADAALAAALAAACCGLAESWDVAIPTALENSYVVPACVAKSIASDALRGPWVALIASCLVVKPSWEAYATVTPVPCVRTASVTWRCPGTELEDTGTRSVDAPLPSTSVTRAAPLHVGVRRSRTVATCGRARSASTS